LYDGDDDLGGYDAISLTTVDSIGSDGQNASVIHQLAANVTGSSREHENTTRVNGSVGVVNGNRPAAAAAAVAVNATESGVPVNYTTITPAELQSHLSTLPGQVCYKEQLRVSYWNE